MDYKPGEVDEVTAIYIGRALVRGTKSFLDVMEPGWRQYTPEPEQPLINSVNIVSGCYEHANQYWIYLVDSRQALSVLNNEPRFLSITPDTALVDLNAAETDHAVKALSLHEINRQGKAEQSQVALPIVVATFYHGSFVPSPAIIKHADGTTVTNFPESLAQWAAVNDQDRTAGCQDTTSEECYNSELVLEAQARYWNGIRKAIRTAEENRLPISEWKANGPPFKCLKLARMGAGSEHARINYSFLPSDLTDIFKDAGYEIDLKRGKLTKLTSSA